jgi:hypothetical protein
MFNRILPEVPTNPARTDIPGKLLIVFKATSPKCKFYCVDGISSEAENPGLERP